MKLTAEQVRVLGCLVEKDMTTPEYYPLSLNGLTLACNQKSNREPHMSLTEVEVTEALDGLRQAGLAVRAADSVRTPKHAHNLPGKLHLDRGELALVGALLLRGPQTIAELRTRSERMHRYADPAELEAMLDGLAAREPPLVVRKERQPGQKEQRYMHLLGAQARAGDAAALSSGTGPAPGVTGTDGPARSGEDAATSADAAGLFARVAQLESEVHYLNGEIAFLKDQLRELQAALGG